MDLFYQLCVVVVNNIGQTMGCKLSRVGEAPGRASYGFFRGASIGKANIEMWK